MAKQENKSAVDRLRQMTEGIVNRQAPTPIQRVVPVEAAEVPADPMLQKKQKSIYLTLALQREMKRAIGPDGKFDGIYKNESDLVEAALRAFLELDRKKED